MQDVKHLTQARNRDILGFGERTIAQSGCLLTLFAMAANALTGTNFTPSRLNNYLRETQCFSGSSLLVPKTAETLGIKLERSRGASPDRVFEHLARPGVLVGLGIDYRKGRSSGVSDADHFVLGHCTMDDIGMPSTLIAADPATGHDVSLVVERHNGTDRLVCRPSARVLWLACETLVLESAT